MQVDDIVSEHDDLDADSLFGSPPPSPRRGRSPSPLALPGGQGVAQNVGTLALPGSHLFSELSELPPALPPPPAAPQVPRQQRFVTVPQSSAQSRSATPAPRVIRSARKPKRASRRSTPASETRPAPPPITLPCPSDPPPLNFLRNQQALLGVAGLVGGVNPATLSVKRPPRGESPSNPIVVDDDGGPMIGRRPVQSSAFVPGRLPTPSTEEIVASLVKQKNLYPILDALLRLITQSSAQAMAAPPTPALQLSPTNNARTTPTPSASVIIPPLHRNQHTFPHYASYPYGCSAPSSSPDVSLPPLKRRKLSDVPAGATDWDVPYPFGTGQGPAGYHTNWERRRQQRLLQDLVGLIKSAANKAAIQKAYGPKEPNNKAVIGSVEYYRDRVMRYYRPHTKTYSRGESPTLQHPSPSPPPSATVSMQAQPSEALAVENATCILTPDFSGAPESSAAPAPTMLQAQQDMSMKDIASQSSSRMSDDTGFPITSSSNFDELLTLFNDIPAAELDALLASSDFSTLCATEDSPSPFTFDIDTTPSVATHWEHSASSSSVGEDTLTLPSFDTSIFSTDPSLLSIDPALLAISFSHAVAKPQAPATQLGSQDDVRQGRMPPMLSVPTAPCPTGTHGTSTAPTPTSAGSPVSLADLDPPTPHWDFTFSEPEIASPDVDSNSQQGGEHRTVQLGRTDLHDGGDLDGDVGKDKGKGKAREVDVPMDDGVDLQQIASSERTTPALVGERPPISSVGTTPLATPSRISLEPAVQPFSLLDNRAPSLRHLAGRFITPQVGIAAASFQVKNREEVLRRARAMRAQIVEEIERAKVELWETTMEGGCLSVVAKEREKMDAQRSP